MPALFGAPPVPPDTAPPYPLLRFGESGVPALPPGPLGAPGMPAEIEILDQDPPSLSFLAGRAWLLVARRHVRMLRLSEEWRQERRVGEACDNCGVCQDDPYASSGVLPEWSAHGPQLRIHETHDIHKLIKSFEVHHSVPPGQPPLPFDDGHWRDWLERHAFWGTLCWRCVGAKGLRPTTPVHGRRVDASSATGQIADVSDDSGSEMSADRSSLSSGGDAVADAFPDWAAVQVSQGSREILLHWAHEARRRLKAQRLQTLAHRRQAVASNGSGSGSVTPQAASTG